MLCWGKEAAHAKIPRPQDQKSHKRPKSAHIQHPCPLEECSLPSRAATRERNHGQQRRIKARRKPLRLEQGRIFMEEAWRNSIVGRNGRNKGREVSRGEGRLVEGTDLQRSCGSCGPRLPAQGQFCIQRSTQPSELDLNLDPGVRSSTYQSPAFCSSKQGAGTRGLAVPRGALRPWGSRYVPGALRPPHLHPSHSHLSHQAASIL